MNADEYMLAAARTVPKEFKPITGVTQLVALYKVLEQSASVGGVADDLKKYLFHGHEISDRLGAFEVDDKTVSVDPVDTRRTLMLTNATLGIIGESGEFTEHLHNFLFHGEALDQRYIEKELGDILWYVSEACLALNVSLGFVMQQNIDKLKARYPDGFSTAASINRKE